MARNDPQMNLRVPVELKEKVEKAAFENGRTITAEAIYRLEKSFYVSFFRITKFDDMKEPAASIEIGPITIGLFQSKYKEIELYEMSLNSWILSYQAVRCYLRDADAKQLLKLGCTYKGSNIRDHE